jgi:hypothetical protein
MSDVQNHPAGEDRMDEAPSCTEQNDIFPEFEALRREISLRIRDNRRFLERIFDEDFGEDEEGEESDGEGVFEEL